MAIMWQSSLVPWLDPNGAPYSGAKAYFFDAGTTTPRTVYRDSNLGQSHDHPVLANASGMFPAIFLPAGDYRLRIEDGSGVTITDVDGISTPSTGGGGGGGGGDTPVELLARTGDLKARFGTGSHSGWVRAAGRSIGNASSGASERANADCADLFSHLWSADPTLAVSGGRGANAATDFASGKRIDLPDFRSRSFVGLADMGNVTSALIPNSMVDGGETNITLGATLGVSEHALSIAQMPSHNHPGSETSQNGEHSHTIPGYASSSVGGAFGSGNTPLANIGTSTAGLHRHDVSVGAQGGGQPHPNMPPSAFVTIYIKL